MLKYIQQSDIDYAKWNTAVWEAKNAMPYFFSWHLDASCNHWDALIYGDYEFIMPLPFNQKLIFAKQIYPPFLTQQLGIIGNDLNPQIIQQFLDNIPSKFKFINYHFHHASEGISATNGFQISKKDNYIIPLDRKEDEILKSFNREVRRNLRKFSSKHNIKPINSSQVIVDFYFKQFREKLNLSQQLYQKITAILDAHLKNDTIEIFGVYDEQDILHCATAFLHSHDRLISIFGGPNDSGKKIYAMHAVYVHLIKKYADTNNILDFMGSEIKGVAFWMRSMGGILQPYYKIEKDELSFITSLIKHRKWKLSKK